MDIIDIPYFSNLKNDVQDLANLENLLISVMNDNKNADLYELLYQEFDKISLASDFVLYHSFLIIISNVSKTCFSGRGKLECVKNILKKLIDSYNLLNLFSQYQLVTIFGECYPLLLFFYEQNIISFSFISELAQKGNEKSLFFFPEIQENDPRFFRSMLSNNEVFFSKFLTNVELFKKIRNDEYYDEIDVLKMIRWDEYDNFINYFSKTNMDLNLSLDEYDVSLFDIKRGKCLKYIDYSILYGAINIFKYLIFKVNCSDTAMKYAIINGNSELIHLLEQYTTIENQKEYLMTAIEYHHVDIYEYFKDKFNITLPPDVELKVILKSANFRQFNVFLDENYSFISEVCNNCLALKYFGYSPFISLLNFSLQQPVNYDINFKDESLLFLL